MIMTETTRAGSKVPPRGSTLDREMAMRLAATEYDRYLEQLRGLEASDWSRPTDCPAWDVRALACHNLGMAKMAATFRETARQNIKAQFRMSRRGGIFIDALTALQVEERTGLDPAEIVARYAEVGPRAASGRRRRPGLFRRAAMPGTEVVNGTPEKWAFGFIIDTILTRDTWMHRVDTAWATGRVPELTAEHDGVLVADVVEEWAARHGNPCTVTLTGPAGGRWSFGDQAGPAVELDAVEFCRILSGRVPGTGLLTVQVPF